MKRREFVKWLGAGLVVGPAVAREMLTEPFKVSNAQYENAIEKALRPYTIQSWDKALRKRAVMGDIYSNLLNGEQWTAGEQKIIKSRRKVPFNRIASTMEGRNGRKGMEDAYL